MDSSDSESDQEQDQQVEDKQQYFVKLLKKNPVLLNKSQVPSIKQAKSKAAAEVLKALEKNLALQMTEKALMKKVNNMKTKLREKTDLTKTGNKKIKLVTWEKELLALLNADSNPVFSQIPGMLDLRS